MCSRRWSCESIVSLSRLALWKSWRSRNSHFSSPHGWLLEYPWIFLFDGDMYPPPDLFSLWTDFFSPFSFLLRLFELQLFISLCILLMFSKVLSMTPVYTSPYDWKTSFALPVTLHSSNKCHIISNKYKCNRCNSTAYLYKEFHELI